MGGLIFLALLVGIMVMFPPSAIIIIPFVVISILVGLGMRSIGESMTEPVRSELHDSAERIAEAIESLRSEHDHPETESRQARRRRHGRVHPGHRPDQCYRC